MTLLTLYTLARLTTLYPHETTAKHLYKHDLLAGLSPLSDTLAVKTTVSFSCTVLLKTL